MIPTSFLRLAKVVPSYKHKNKENLIIFTVNEVWLILDM